MKFNKSLILEYSTNVKMINGIELIQIPETVSKKLPSRGIVMVKGKINGSEFKAVLEPDGKGSHWFGLKKNMAKLTQINLGDKVYIEMEVVADWIEPNLPADLSKAIEKSSKTKEIWNSLTPMARWDWIRWINATNNGETRKRRIDTAIDKLINGKRRPCCFNRSQCTNYEVSKDGKLLV